MTNKALVKTTDTFKVKLEKFMPAIKSAIAPGISKQITSERFEKVALSAVMSNPLLQQCDEKSVLQKLFECASYGLLPSGGLLGQAYLIPFKNNKTGKLEAQLIVGYKGLITLARRSGDVSSINAFLVYEHEEFKIEYGLNPTIEHKPILDGKDKGKRIGGYCVVTFKDGSKQFDFLPEYKIQEARKSSKSRDRGPWVTHDDEMALKTCIRYTLKKVPLSDDLIPRALKDEDKIERPDMNNNDEDIYDAEFTEQYDSVFNEVENQVSERDKKETSSDQLLKRLENKEG